MRGAYFNRLIALVIFAFAALGAAPLSADHGKDRFPSQCHAVSGKAATLAEMMRPETAWDCSQSGWSNSRYSAWLRFDASAWQDAETPTAMVTRITRFSQITLSAIERGGTVRSVHYGPEDARTLPGGPHFSLDLPPIGADTLAVVARIDEPHNVTVLSEAQLTAHSAAAGWTVQELLLLAALAGMLVAPLFFDINFYLVLRERFVLLHAAMVVSMIGYLMFSGGLITAIVRVPLSVIAVAGPLFWTMAVALSAFFFIAFVERGVLTRAMRRAMVFAGCWAIAVPGFFALQLPLTQAIDNRGYFFGFLPVLVIYAVVLVQALRRGSRAAQFVAVAWVPIIFAAVERLLRGVGAYSAPPSLDHLLFVVLALEVIIIALGVADRFLAVRRERDSAVTEARMLEELSERDPLTGLMNRRAIEPRFGELYRSGYSTIALLDLDRFKDVNDVFGHAVGDQVLRATAQAFHGQGDLLAIRMGGEEFLLLLRGRNPIERAERLRQSVAQRVAREVDGLDRVVTASMGVIQGPLDTEISQSFDEFYQAADKLLYEAKAGGRNRMISEKMKVFVPRRSQRRKPSAAAAA